MIDFGLRSDIVEHFVCLSTDTGHLAREGVSEAIVRPEAYYLNRTKRQHLEQMHVQSR